MITGHRQLLFDLLQARGLASPGRTAYTFLQEAGGVTNVGYGELGRQARAIAARLQQLGGQGERALLLYPPGLEFVASFLGCFGGGIVAVPIQPMTSERGLPRLLAIARDARATCALTTTRMLGRLQALAGRAPELSDLTWVATDQISEDLATEWRDPQPEPESLAFLQYTSGSTALPKGVQVSHGNLVHNEEMIRRAFGQSEKSVIVGWLPLYHDMGLIGNVLQPLYLGAHAVLMAPAAFMKRPVSWLEAITRYRATTSGGPNFAYELCLRKVGDEERAGLDLSSWEVAFNGAEPVRADTLERFACAFAPQGFRRSAFYPCYGLAEATLFVSGGGKESLPVTLPVDRPALERGEAVSPAPGEAGVELAGCGHSWMEQRLAIVDPESCRLLGEGRVGEIWVSGPSVAQGYWGRPDETERDFHAHLAGTGEGPFLRTGDLGFLQGGELFVTGRLKDLIILRGRNLYPQDLELSAERSHPELRPGCGAAFSLDLDGEERLVFVCEVEPRTGTPGEAIAEAICQAVAEEHEVQAHEVVLLAPGTIPKTSSGKIQRRVCRQHYLSGELAVRWRSGSRAAVEPAGDTIAEQVARILGVPAASLDPRKPLTAYGLDSLAAVEIQHALESRLGVSVDLAELLRGMTLQRLAAQALPGSAAPPLRPVPRTGSLPLSFAQERLWFLDQLEPGRATYNIPAAVRLAGRLDIGTLSASLREIVRRHEALRTIFALDQDQTQGRPVQRITPAGPWSLPVVDLGGLGGSAKVEATYRLAAEESRRGVDLERGPLWRAALLRLESEEHLLLLTLHHTVADGWSMGVFGRELSALYAAFSAGQASPLPELPVQYADFAVWQREHLSGEILEGLLAHWRQRLAGAPVLDLPTDRPPLKAGGPRGVSQPVSLAPELAGRLEALARREGGTLFMALLGGLAALLARWTGQEDVSVGTAIANRSRAETEDLIGFFANTLVLRVGLAGEPPGRALLERIRDVALAAYAHQDLPFERLVQDLQPRRDAETSPLVRVVLTLGPDPALGLALPGLAAEARPLDTGTAKFDLTLQLWSGERGLAGLLESRSDLFDAPTPRRLIDQLAVLLTGLANDPERPVSELPLSTAAERHQLLAEWSGAAPRRPLEDTIPGLLARQAELRPDAVAVLQGGLQITYAELDRRANHLARHLLRLGVGPEIPVGLALERSVDLIVALAAVAKSGGAYLPFDPGHPRKRQDFLLAQAGARIVLTPDVLRGLGEEESAEPPAVAVHPDNLAHILFTSGSTGEPKGVAVTHRGVVRLVRDTDYASFGPDEVFLQLAPVAFDASTLEIWAPLLNGGRLVLAPTGPVALAELETLIARERVTTLFLTSGLFHQAIDHGMELPGLRRLLSGGDVLSPPHVRRALERNPGCVLFNCYGPTENTTITSCHRMARPEEAGSPVPIGQPIARTTIYVVDAAGQPSPVGVPGELWVGGDGLARGYAGRPDLTAERFVPHPFGAPGERLYRTGDRVRFLPDGTVEFLGRIDQQVKIRGFRIEPGEIEAVLAIHPGVETVAVVPQDAGPDDRRLVAYLVPRSGQALTDEDLRALAAERLPGYMVPAAFVALAGLPLTSNGKLDRRALPRPDWGRREEAATAAPLHPAEELLAGLWAELLGLDPSRVGTEADFFALGGHSLLATRLISRIREELWVELPVRALFEAPTPAGLARRVLAARGGLEAPPIRPVPRTGRLPLSFAQERLWFLDRLEPGGATYNIPAAVWLEGTLDVPALAASLREISRRHEALRTVFAMEEGEPVQRIPLPASGDLPVVDLDGMAGEVARLGAEEARRGFDLERGPLWRAMLLRLGTEEHELLLNLHHIVADGWSMRVLVRELSVLYTAFAAGRPSPLPDLPVQYADFARWQRDWMSGEVLEGQLSFWRDHLAGAPVLELPTDRPPVKARRARGASLPIGLPRPLEQALGEIARRERVTLFMVLLGGFAALLSRWTGQDDVSLGTAIANRTRGETEPLIGFFVNTLALRAGLSGDPDGRGLLARMRDVALAAYAHQDLPFERLVQEIQPRRDAETVPLVRALLSLGADPALGLELPGLTIAARPLETGTTKVDLSLQLAVSDRGLAGVLEYRTDLFDAPTLRRLLDQLTVLLGELVADPRRRLSDLHVLTAAERHHLLAEWSGAAPRCSLEDTIPGLFALQARLRPDAVAVLQADRQMTYAELDHRADLLARHLLRLGVGPEIPVGVALERSLDLIVALVAIAKSGGAYLPLDPGHPRQRLDFLVAQAGARIVLTPELLRGLGEPGSAGASAVDPDQLAYILYTSGSTGTPKGVAVTHRAVVRLVRDTGYASFGPGEVFLQLAPVAFDASTLEIWGPLLNSGRLVLAPAGPVALAELEQVIARERVTTLWLTAGLFHQAIDQGLDLRGLRQLLAGGDVLSPAHVHRALERFPGCVLINGYGPTENTTFTCCHRMTRPEEVGAPVSVGRPIARTTVHVVDAAGQPSPVGVPGELWVGGDGLARGYVGRPDLTAERFVPDPFGGSSGDGGARLYRTGDRVRFLPDGTVEFLGRLDQQVKIRGFRIEPGEIEVVLSVHPGVETVAVVPLDVGPDDRRLVAYVVPRSAQGLDLDGLRALAADRLPGYMVPAAFVALGTLPLTPNGKVDRRALPQPDWGGREEGRVAAAPSNPTEELLVGIWAEILDLDPGRLGTDAHFFDLGGHSLLATRLLSRVREDLRVDVPLVELFDDPTPAGCARLVQEARADAAPPIRPVPRTAGLPLSFAQERLWFLDRLEPGSETYNIPLAVRLAGVLDVPALAAALREVACRHEALRTTFAVEEGRPMQRIHPTGPFLLPVVDLRGAAGPWEEARRLVAADSRRGFDLERGPLWRATLLRLGENEHLLLLDLHHIVADGWSMGVLVRELSTLYRGAPLREPDLQYADVAAWQRERLAGGALAAQSESWKRRLAGLSVLRLPTDRPHRPARSGRGTSVGFSLSPGLRTALEALARRERTTLFMVLLGAFQALLSRLADQEDIAVGTAIANRNRAETESLIGLFVNTLVLRTDLAGDPDRRELLRRVREVTLEAYAHQDLPFEKLVEELAPERDLSRSPLVDVLLILQNMPLPALALPGVTAEPLPIPSHAARLDLTVSLAPEGHGLAGWAEFATDLFDEATVRRLLGRFELVLQALARDTGDEPRLSTLPLLTPAERAQLLVEWNDTGASVSDGRCLHDLFAAQAVRTPEATAVVCGDIRLTYGELESRADRLARRLCGLGVGPETPVGVCLERGPELVPVLLGILQAGGAYVPLDPAYPQERLSLILEDAQVPVVVTRASLEPRLAGGPTRVLVDAEHEAIEAPEILEAPLDPDHLAYFIYTSGSTGRPKGVAITHRSAVALVRWAMERFSAAELAGVLASTSISFDLSVFELFVPLSQGGTVLLAADALALPELPAAAEVTLINTVPSAIAELVRLGPPPPKLRTVNLAGEPLPRALVEQIERWQPGVRVFDLYGPSEDTTYSTWALVSGAEGIPSIGRPIAGTSVYLLDRHGDPVPAGVPGELHLAGAGLARGYFGRPDLTAARFVPDPFAAQPGGRLYATGDLARLRPDGQLDFLGRIDHQVKIRGFRIEPGEIEAVLGSHPGLEAVAVVPQEAGPDDRRLVAYVVARPGWVLGLGELRGLAARRLPGHMVPAAFVALPALPLTPNGKLDRRALPRPDWLRGGALQEAVTPRNPTEELLVQLWAELLGLDPDRVGIGTDFFTSGGHSLLATRLISRVREDLRVEVPVRGLFEAPTPARFARLVLAARPGGEAPPIRPVPRTGSLPLSFAQERLWFLDQLEPGAATYNLPTAVRLAGRLDIAALAASLAEIVRRHEALRTVFAVEEGRPVQRILSPGPADAVLPVVDLGGLAGCEEAARRLVAEESGRSFDLERGPLWRATLLRRAPEEHLLLLTLHHIVSDGWSMGVLIRELSALYTASPLPELAIQYADVAVWQRERLASGALAAESEHWQRQLADLSLLQLPTDRPYGPDRSSRGASVAFSLAPEVRTGLEALARRERATLFMVLLAGFQALLARWAGQEDVAVGTAVANRNRAETEDLIGFFVNTLVLRTDLAGDPERDELLRRVREVTLDAYAHQDLPFEKLVEELAPERDLGRTPLINVLLVLQNMPLPDLALPGLAAELVPVPGRAARLDLTLSLSPGGEGLAGSLEFATDLYDEATVLRLLADFEQVLERLADATAKEPRLSTLLLLASAPPVRGLREPWRREEPATVVPPRDPVEELLVGLWAELLGLDGQAVGIHTHFFAAGGHSLLATRLISRVRMELRVEVPVRAVFAAPTPASLARRLRASSQEPEEPPIRPVSRAGSLPLSFAQERLWFLDQLEPGSATYNIPLIVRLAGRLDIAALAAGLGEIVRRHEALRTTFAMEEGRPVQRIASPEPATAVLPVADLGGLAGCEEAARRLAVEESGRSFDLERGPLWRVTLLRLGPEEHLLLLTLHHIVADGWSMGVLIRELSALYRGAPLAGLPVQYADVAVWQRSRLESGGLAAQSTWWKRQLADLSPLALPTDRPYGPTRSSRGASVAISLPTGIRAGLEALARREGATLFMVLLAGFQALLARWADQEDVAVGTAVANRNRAETEDLIGLFVNTLVLRTDLSGDPARGELLRRVREVTLDTYAHQDLPFEKLVEELAPERDPGRTPLVNVLLVLQNMPLPALVLPGLAAELLPVPGRTARLDLTLSLAPDGEGLAGALEFATDLFDESTVLRLLADFEQVLDRMADAAAEEPRLSTFPLSAGQLSAAPVKVRGRREEPRATPASPCDPVEELLVRLWVELLGLEERAGEVGIDTNFFAAGGHSLLATRLISRVRTELRVEVPVRAVFAAPTPASLARRLRAASQGLEETPIRPVPRTGSLPLSFAQERLWFLDQLEPGSATYNIPLAVRLEGRLDTAALAAGLQEIVRRHEALRTTFAMEEGGPVQRIASPGPASLPVVDLSGLSRPSEAARGLGADEAGRSFDLERGPLWRATLLRLAEEEHILLLTLHHIVSDGWSMGVLVRELSAFSAALPLAELPIQYADVAVWQRSRLESGVLAEQSSWWTRHLADLAMLRLPTDCPYRPARSSRGASVSFQLSPGTRAALETLAQRERATLFMVLLGGFQALLARWSDQEDVAIGTAAANRNRTETEDLIGLFVNTLVLRTDLSGDPDRRELLRRVREVTLDAYAHQDLPFEKLVEELAPERDLSRAPLIGVLLILQNMPLPDLSLPGITAEPLPVPSQSARLDLTLSLFPSGEGLAGQAEFSTDLFDATTVRRLLAHFEQVLAGLASAAGDEPRLSSLLLLTAADQDQLMRLRSVNLAGEPLQWAEPAGTASAPRSQLEAVVAEVLAATLGFERIGVEDDFFDLGGHSLLATRAVSRLRTALAVDLPVRQIFETPTAAALAAAIGRRQAEARSVEPPIVRVPRTGRLPLSLSQERLYFLDRLQPESAAYNMPVAARLRGSLDPALLARSLDEVVRRHETLRTTFDAVDGQPFQRIAGRLEIPLPVLDLGGLAGPERDAELGRQIAAEKAIPFDLRQGPLLRARLFRLGAEDWVLLLDLHHIVTDGWSLRRMFGELVRLYGAFAAGEPSPLPELEVQYADYAGWQRQWLQGAVLESLLDYWRGQLSGTLPVLDLPTDRVRPPVQTFRGASRSAVLPATLGAGLRALGRQQGTTVFMTMFAAFNLLLQRHSGQEDILVGIPIAGRNRPQIEDLIGFFINSLVLRTDLSGQPAFSELLARVRRTALDAYAHQDLSFERLLQELRLERDLSRTPLFQVYFNFQGFMDPLPALPGLAVESLSGDEELSKFDLTLYVLEDGEGQIRLDLVYNAALFSAERCRGLLDQYLALLAQAAARPDVGIDRFSLLTPEALRILPDPAEPLDPGWIGPVHQYPTIWAARDPERPAVSDPTGTWSYGELEAQSNRLAHRLLADGVRQGDAVAIYAHRSATLVWAVLGTLKAGAAFVALDPSYPPARIIEILRLARPRAWLAMESAGAVPEPLARFVAELPGCLRLELPPWHLATAGGALAALPAEDPGVPIGPDDLAYIAFTSGSTGTPKGVLGRHGPLSHFLPWQRETFGLAGADRFSLLSGLAHDPLQRDLFTPLYLGARISIPDPTQVIVPGKLSAWMRREEVTVAHLTPAMGQVLTENAAETAETLPALRYVFLVGDILTRRDVARLQRLAPGVTCVNLYGSTETQRAVGYHRVPPADFAPAESHKEVLPLGRGMQDVQLLVRNRAGERAGIGEIGEIAVRSPHLSRGYLGDEETTARKFLVNPVTGDPGDRLYLTGDLGRHLPNGEVAFAGRADQQVKIRGFRIELGEVESQLGRIAGVREAVVLATEDNGIKGRLVAFVVPAPGAEAALSAADLRQRLKEVLPAYMVPGSLIFLPEVPLTPNRKIDRRALLHRALLHRASLHREDGGSFQAPRTEAELRIAGILREVLGVERIGAEDNFFDLGGNSLLLLQVQSRVQAAFDCELPVIDLFSHPTVSALARHLAVPEPTAPAAAADEAAEQLEAGRRRRQRRFLQNQKAAERRPGGMP